MLAKLTDNQLTLPDSVLEALGRPTHVNLEVRDGRLFMSPADLSLNDEVRRKMDEMGITEDVVAEAVEWARRRD